MRNLTFTMFPETLRAPHHNLSQAGLTETSFPGSVLGRGNASAMPRPRKYPPELLERGARLVFESGRPIKHVADDLGISPEVLRRR